MGEVWYDLVDMLFCLLYQCVLVGSKVCINVVIGIMQLEVEICCYLVIV